MIILIPAENVCFRNFPALFSRLGGVVTGGGGVFGCAIQCTLPMFKAKMLIYQSKAKGPVIINGGGWGGRY